MKPDLFASLENKLEGQPLGDGAVLLPGYALRYEAALLPAVEAIAGAAPFRNMMTPGGHTMSVAMTNCGDLGWVTDRRGYRYESRDPLSDAHWPAMPDVFMDLAISAAAAGGYPGFAPNSCLVNRYQPGAHMTLHQDRDEGDFSKPIVSVSLGLPAKFLFGGLQRTDKPRRILLHHGDVCVWGGPSRLAFHGIDPLKDGQHELLGAMRVNLTFRQVNSGEC